MARVGLLGGTFDPIHWGHLLLADCAREALALDRVIFIPAGRPPHKAVATAEADHRLSMTRLAVADNPAFEVSDVELQRAGPSYSVDTVAHFRRTLVPDAELFFLLGADSLSELPTWREPARLAALATLAAASRPGVETHNLAGLVGVLSQEQIASLRRHWIPMPLVDLASRDIRRRAARGQSIRYMVPAVVWDYIQAHGLYRPDEAAGPSRAP